MGMGYALYEERIMDPQSGVVLNPNFETYKLSAWATFRNSMWCFSTCLNAA